MRRFRCCVNRGVKKRVEKIYLPSIGRQVIRSEICYFGWSASSFHTPALSAAPTNGATMKSHSCDRA